VVLVAVLLIFSELYGVTPFFTALALGGIIGYISVVALRLSRRCDVTLGTIRLKKHGRMVVAGGAFAVFFACLVAFVGHSALIRYHEFIGGRQALAITESPNRDQRMAVAAEAYRHLSFAQRWGLFQNELTQRGLFNALFHLRRFDEARTCLSGLLERHPTSAVLRVQLGECLVQQNRIAAAERQFRSVIAQGTRGDGHNVSALASAHQWLGNIQARQGRFAAAARDLGEAVRLDPNRPSARAALGSVLAELGEFDKAGACLRETVRLDPGMGRAQPTRSVFPKQKHPGDPKH
jgi:hypothetical protein